MTNEFQPGDRVAWNKGKIKGTVEKKLTEPTQVSGHEVKASEKVPQYLVKSEKTGKEAAHKPESLKKLED